METWLLHWKEATELGYRLITYTQPYFLSPPRKTDKAQYTGCSVHENNNGQATFENPMYNTNTKAAEGKVVRFDPNLNTICTMV